MYFIGCTKGRVNIINKLCILQAVVAGVALADTGYPAPSPIYIVADDRTQNSYGEYSFAYKGSDGTARDESGSQNYGQNSEGGWR